MQMHTFVPREHLQYKLFADGWGNFTHVICQSVHHYCNHCVIDVLAWDLELKEAPKDAWCMCKHS